MPTILLEVAIASTQALDGTTFRDPSAFTYTQAGRNHYVADASDFAPGDLGVFDLRGMLFALDSLFPSAPGNAVDLNAVHAQNRNRLTDLLVERVVLLSTGSVVRSIGVATPSLPGIADGAQDQPTPNEMPTTNANVFRYGGSGFTATALTTPGGIVSVPTEYRFFVQSNGADPQRIMFWLLPNYGCSCWGTFGSDSAAGAGG